MALLKRGAVENTVAAFPDLWISGTGGETGEVDRAVPCLFCLQEDELVVEDEMGTAASEYEAFAARWRAVGHSVFVDTTISLAHRGRFTFASQTHHERNVVHGGLVTYRSWMTPEDLERVKARAKGQGRKGKGEGEG